MSTEHLSQGKAGEALAEKYLTQKEKLKIIKRNWRCFLGEIDFVAKDNNDTLVFIEVKSRRGDEEGAWGAIDERKQAKLKRLAHAYLKNNNLPLETPMRFDALAVELETSQVHYITNALMFENEL